MSVNFSVENMHRCRHRCCCYHCCRCVLANLNCNQTNEYIPQHTVCQSKQQQQILTNRIIMWMFEIRKWNHFRRKIWDRIVTIWDFHLSFYLLLCLPRFDGGAHITFHGCLSRACLIATYSKNLLLHGTNTQTGTEAMDERVCVHLNDVCQDPKARNERNSLFFHSFFLWTSNIFRYSLPMRWIALTHVCYFMWNDKSTSTRM